MHGFNELLAGFPGVLCSRQKTHKERKIFTFDFTPVAIDTTTCFALSCLRGLNMEWPSDIFNPLHAKDAFISQFHTGMYLLANLGTAYSLA